MTLSDLEWPFHASRAISAVVKFLDIVLLHDLRLWMLMHKFVDYTTVSDITEKDIVPLKCSVQLT